MAIEKFKDIAYRRDTQQIIASAQAIADDFKARGFVLTVRQMFYQFVRSNLIENKQSQYKRLASIIDDARQTGHLDWSMIEDRTRNLKSPNTWGSPEEILSAVARQYMENPWQSQEIWPEVWIEKDALMGVIEPVCNEFRVPYFACKGYASQSEIYEAAKRFQRLRRAGFRPVVFYLGDHDPSGMHMPLNIAEKLELFSRGDVEVRRLALNMDQIDQYAPPPNPAKESDSRFEAYAAEHGEDSWELDALDPDVISQLIRAEIEGVMDAGAWEECMEREKDNSLGLQGVNQHFERVKLYLKHRGDYLDLNDFDEEERGEFSDLDDLLDKIAERD